MNDKPPSRRRARGSLEFYSEIPRARVRKSYTLACAAAAMRRIPNSVATIRLVLIGDRKMAALHRQFLDLRGTTDVLTFTLSDADEPLEGEIYICLDQARRQAKEYRVPLYEEVARLAAHGILHLAGHDDHSEPGQREMRKLEDAALRVGRAA